MAWAYRIMEKLRVETDASVVAISDMILLIQLYYTSMILQPGPSEVGGEGWKSGWPPQALHFGGPYGQSHIGPATATMCHRCRKPPALLWLLPPTWAPHRLICPRPCTPLAGALSAAIQVQWNVPVLILLHSEFKLEQLSSLALLQAHADVIGRW